MRYLLFIIISCYVANWAPINLFLDSLLRKRGKFEEIRDNRLLSHIYNKTKLKLKSIRLLHSEKTFGMMVGIPSKPYMILSKELLNEFTDQEIKYVTLHEAGHYLLHHAIKSAFILILLIILGCIFIKNIPIFDLLFPIILGICTGIISIQFSKKFEYEAERFALERLDDLNAQITATKKFQKNNPLSKYQGTLIDKLFFVGIPYDERILLAKQTRNKK